MSGRLGAIVDGKELKEVEARELWAEFSAHLDEHQLDFKGFAAKKGWSSIKPEHKGGRAVLVVVTVPKAKPSRPRR